MERETFLVGSFRPIKLRENISTDSVGLVANYFSRNYFDFFCPCIAYP